MRRTLCVLAAVILGGCAGAGGTAIEQDVPGAESAADVAADPGHEGGPADGGVEEAGLSDSTGDDGEVAPDAACQTGTGCPGDPCEDNQGCVSGLCVDHLGGRVCTDFCVEDCPDGFACEQMTLTGPDPVWACASDFPTLCRPCAEDDDCAALGLAVPVRCLVYPGEGSFCGGACGAGQACPEGFACKEALTVDGVTLSQCVRASGVCPCSDASISLGLWTPCVQENEHGKCEGKRVCAEGGLGPCDAAVPAVETCNGVDDDCDGGTDEESCDDGNDCTKDGCDPAAGCFHQALDAGKCDDGDSCTLGDKCQAGACQGEPVVCNDGNPCTEDVCSAETGCTFPASGGACDDGDPCSFGDYCKAGQCMAGVVLECDDGNPCTKDVCDVESGCSHAAAAGPCDDGNPCTEGETCDGGLCAPQGPVDCDDDEPCTNDWCDPASGCQHQPNTASCNDGSLCTLGDACALGSCVAGQKLDCDDGNPCTADTCNPLLGCAHVANSQACDDQDPCTAVDKCVAGGCVGTGAADCDDGSPCTADFCEPLVGCDHAPAAGSCEDGSACTFGDKCQAGLCTAGKPISCDDGNVCTDDTCAAGSGCVHKANAAACDDQNDCTTDDHCAKGACVSQQSAACDDGDPCTTDTCLPQGGCMFLPNTAPCDDGDACTSGDKCDKGVCKGGLELDCNDGNPCTADSCEVGACKHAPAGGACDDGNPCTANDGCSQGKCKGGGPAACDDGNVCTSDWCDPASGCIHQVNAAPCEDGDLCTTGDVCDKGACKAGTSINCNDGNPCTEDSCAGGSCIHKATSGNCDDKNPCTTGDHCDQGSCVAGGFPDCDDGNLCTTDWCDPTVGCAHKMNTFPCDDGSACTTGDKCSQGSCVPGPQIMCDDGNLCTDDACDPATGCTHANNAAGCDDGSKCTLNDACSGGKCAGGGALTCDDGNLCTTDKCDPAAGCQYTPKTPCCGNGNVEAGEQCDDGNLVNGDGCNSACQTEVPAAPECQNYKTLTESTRNVTFNDGNGGVEYCDSGFSGWYRYTGAAGTKMPTSCPALYACGTDAPGWMQGGYPTVAEGAVSRTVCFHWDSGCCTWSTSIQVRNCGNFHVFKFQGTPACMLTYCGEN